jgi:hypothetical protein
MNDVDTIPAPTIPIPRKSKLNEEQEAYRRLLPDLLKTHRDLYVAIHEGQVVESGPDKLAVAATAYSRFGYLPILVTLVTDAPPNVVHIRSPRSPRSE